MAIVLGGVTLSPDMFWRERHQSQKVLQSTRLTLGAKPVVYAAAIDKGLPVTLIAAERMGWIRRSVLDLVLEMAESAGGEFLLTMPGFSATVVFRHEEPPAVAFEPVRRTNVPLATDWMRGEIRLLTV